MFSYRVVSELYHKIIDSMFSELQDVDCSILKSEIISHPISGAVRATLINRCDVHEDIIMIGDTLIETLWPWLWKKYNGDSVKINKALVDYDAMVLVNRPPTINHNSIMALYPRIASVYPVGKTAGTDFCRKHNEIYDGKDLYGNVDKTDKNYGDIEKYGQGLEIDPETGLADGIDTLGLRCVGLNPIMMDTMNADVDGDVTLEIALYSKAALKEAIQITPSKSYLNYANGTIRNHIIEDFIYAEQCKDEKESKTEN